MAKVLSPWKRPASYTGRFSHYSNDPTQHFKPFPDEYCWVISREDGSEHFSVLAREDDFADGMLVARIVCALNDRESPPLKSWISVEEPEGQAEGQAELRDQIATLRAEWKEMARAILAKSREDKALEEA